MTTVKRLIDLSDYTTVLPYASETFGVYQPLLGWRSRRTQKRFADGFKSDKRSLVEVLRSRFAPVVEVRQDGDGRATRRLRPGIIQGGTSRSFDTVVMNEIATRLPSFDDYKPSVWNDVITSGRLNDILEKRVLPHYAKRDLRSEPGPGFNPLVSPEQALARTEGTVTVSEAALLKHQLQYESSVAGTLLYLTREKQADTLKEVFYSTKDNREEAERLARIAHSTEPTDAYLDLEHLDPRNRADIQGAVLSPISVVHLFRQYFFELDTFLGTPESHVWLSPGSSVELIQVHTRRSLIERSLETTLETTTRAETTTTEQDELSDAVKQANTQDTKFGASVTASYGSIEATSSFDYNTSQENARELTHKQMRQQTETLSTEIRKNYKTTFRTITELTDMSSVKHILANTTNELLNYELRRKMRQVGVQVQDIGTYLCWQTFVDDPGSALGVAKLIHIAEPADLESIPHPEEIPALAPFQEERMVTIPFISVEDTGADNEGEVYVDGVEVDDSEWFGNLEKIQADFDQKFVCPRSNYELAGVECDAQGKPLSVSRKGSISNTTDGASFTLHLDSVDFQGQNSIEVKLILHWSPKAGANEEIEEKNRQNLAAFTAREREAQERAYVQAMKERVNASSKVEGRNSADLREEERIAIYRKLIQDMLLGGVTVTDGRTAHVVSELIKAIFDVDKMLYFVAPEWWRPRLHHSRQDLHESPDVDVGPRPPLGGVWTDSPSKALTLARSMGSGDGYADAVAASTVGWGGVNDVQRDNYFITDESAPARLGSSLGWLLQLDGDDMRNAFLNAPWVKAVIPVRPGKEDAAINWLKGVEGMNGISDDVVYHSDNPDEKDVDGDPLDGQKLIDVLLDLAEKIRRKHAAGMKVGKYPKADEVTDPALVDDAVTVLSTPIDRVYEHGFFPLKSSFRANVGANYEIFDQWIEIVPTDQVVPVEVEYDPKTGRQV
jgi:hypothetical protein